VLVKALTLSFIVLLPVVAYARIQGDKVIHVPEIVRSGNSQTIALLEAYSNINPTGVGGPTIYIADKLALASNGEETGPFIDLGKSGTGEISVYVVRKGDTLSEIAEMFGVSTNTIIWANDLRGTSIKEGQELVILPISGVRHVVKKGDTLQTISKNYKADLEDIYSYNGLSATSKIIPGDIIIIPDGVINAPQTTIARVSTAPSAQSFPSYAGYYLRPIVGGKRSQGIHGNNGVDLAAPVGTPVMAAADGRVLVSRSGGYNGGYGIYVVISHSNGTQTLYAHMSANYVSAGQEVSQGQAIGAIGMTGRTTGPHLHFEVRGARNPF
jgi:LysM repeat protein